MASVEVGTGSSTSHSFVGFPVAGLRASMRLNTPVKTRIKPAKTSHVLAGTGTLTTIQRSTFCRGRQSQQNQTNLD